MLRHHNIQLIPTTRPRKKVKPTTMSASAESRLAKAKTFVEKDLAEHKVGLEIAMVVAS